MLLFGCVALPWQVWKVSGDSGASWGLLGFFVGNAGVSVAGYRADESGLLSWDGSLTGAVSAYHYNVSVEVFFENYSGGDVRPCVVLPSLRACVPLILLSESLLHSVARPSGACVVSLLIHRFPRLLLLLRTTHFARCPRWTLASRRHTRTGHCPLAWIMQRPVRRVRLGKPPARRTPRFAFLPLSH